MAELTINQLIKIIIGLLVVVVVLIGIGMFMKNYVLDYFKNLPTGNITKLCLSLI